MVAALEKDLEAAETARADKKAEILELEDALQEAEEALATARKARGELLTDIENGSNPGGQCNAAGRTQEAKRACDEAKVALPDAEEAVTAATNEVKALGTAIEAATDELVALEGTVADLLVALDGDGEGQPGARRELADAIAARDAARLAVANHEAPETEAPHPGCTGIANAKSKASQGKAPEALSKVAEKLGC